MVDATSRVVIGGTDCTEWIERLAASAPPFTADQRFHLGRLFRAAARVAQASSSHQVVGGHAGVCGE